MSRFFAPFGSGSESAGHIEKTGSEKKSLLRRKTSTCLCFLSAKIKYIHHDVQPHVHAVLEFLNQMRHAIVT